MVVVRYRYRPAPIQPALTDGKVGESLSLAKQEIPEEEDPLAELLATAWEEPAFLPSQTQQQRKVTFAYSNEEEYRKQRYPTIHERVEGQKVWAQQQLQATKIATHRAAIKRSLEKSQAAATGDPTDENIERYERELEDLLKESEEDILGTGQGGGGRGAEVSESLAKQLMALKEKKLMANKKTDQYHKQYTLWQRRRIAMAVKLGWYKKTLGEASVVLPWLLIGRRELSADIQKLLTLGITHILNMTHDSPNMFPNSFVYQQVEIRDSPETDLSPHFQRIVSFIERVENCKGRLLVHCTAGASRAPSAVLAYLVTHKKLSLFDAYNYLTFVRNVVHPNNGFLFQLAMLEVKLCGCSSVYYHQDWRFFEFNTFRSKGVPGRKKLGMYATVMQLFDVVREIEGSREMKQLFGD